MAPALPQSAGNPYYYSADNPYCYSANNRFAQSAGKPYWRSEDKWMLATLGRGSAARSAAMGECGGHFWAPAYRRRAGRTFHPNQSAHMIPGEYLLGDGDIEANAGRRTAQLTVANTADRPIQVGSHFHFFEANRGLRFDRGKAFGMRLNVPAGTAVRFEPGDEKVVTLVELAGAREVYGLNALTDGSAGAPGRAASVKRAKAGGFLGAGS